MNFENKSKPCMRQCKVWLATDAVPTRLNPWGVSMFERVLKAARFADQSTYQLVSKVEQADIIVIVEPHDYYQSRLLNSDFYRTYRDRTIVFSQQDNCLPRVPGIYNRIPFISRNMPYYEYGFYTKVYDFNSLDAIAIDQPRAHLFSFIGNVAADPKVRGTVMQLKNAEALLVDSQLAFTDTGNSYIESIANSDFVLCPRGRGPLSFRIFETMRAGRVPVIISDEWRPNEGVNWFDFSIIVAESEIPLIPKMLQDRRDEAKQMGIRARQAYRDFYSLEHSFSFLVSRANEILKSYSSSSSPKPRSLLMQALRYRQIKSVVGELGRNLVDRSEPKFTHTS